MTTYEAVGRKILCVDQAGAHLAGDEGVVGTLCPSVVLGITASSFTTANHFPHRRRSSRPSWRASAVPHLSGDQNLPVVAGDIDMHLCRQGSAWMRLDDHQFDGFVLDLCPCSSAVNRHHPTEGCSAKDHGVAHPPDRLPQCRSRQTTRSKYDSYKSSFLNLLFTKQLGVHAVAQNN